MTRVYDGMEWRHQPEPARLRLLGSRFDVVSVAVIAPCKLLGVELIESFDDIWIKLDST